MPHDEQSYIDQHTTREPDLIRQLVEDSDENLDHIDMLSGNQVGLILRMLVRTGRCRRVLEIGTFTGYSALWMADALPDKGELITLEMNEHYKVVSDRYFSREPYRQKIRQIIGPALESIEDLEGMFDLIFLDADKVQYPDYFNKVKPLLNRGGILVVDNAFWGGTVLRPDDEKSEAVHRLNQLIQNDSDFENTILPIRDGLLIAVKL